MPGAMLRWLGPAALLFLAMCGGGGAGPEIDQVLPASARRGDVVEILGDRFCSDEGAGTAGETPCPGVAAFVSFGEQASVIRADADLYSQRRISVVVPEDAPGGAGTIVVTRDGMPSNVASFEVLN